MPEREPLSRNRRFRCIIIWERGEHRSTLVLMTLWCEVEATSQSKEEKDDDGIKVRVCWRLPIDNTSLKSSSRALVSFIAFNDGQRMDGRTLRTKVHRNRKEESKILSSFFGYYIVNEIIVIVDIVVNWWFRVIARDCRLSLGKYEWTINNRIWWGFDRMDQQPNKIRWLENWISSVSVNRLLSNHAVQCRRMWPPVSTAEVFLIPGSWQVIQT